MEQNEKITLLGKGVHIGEQLAEVAGKAEPLKTAASHAVEDAMTEAKRFAKRSRHAAEDLMEDTAHRVKRSTTLNRPRFGDRPLHRCARCMAGDEQRVGKEIGLTVPADWVDER